MTDTAAPRVPAATKAAEPAHAAVDDTTDAPVVDLGADWHVHTDLGCGSASAVGMVDAAQAAGLHTVGLSDRATAATEWLPDYVAMVRSFARPGITVTCGVETAVLDLEGHLDLPAELPELDYVVLVVDALPTPDGPVRPEAVRAALSARDTTPGAVIDAVIGATVAAVATSPAPVVLGRLFGLLTELGLDDTVVTDDQLDVLATACRAAGARVAITTPATTPSARVATLLAAADVALVAGSDARSPEQVGPHDAAAPDRPATPATALQEIVAADGTDLAAAVHEELAVELEELADEREDLADATDASTPDPAA